MKEKLEMHVCPVCSSARIGLVGMAPPRVLMECRSCPTEWELLTVNEAYLRDLISRSLELAALKRALK